VGNADQRHHHSHADGGADQHRLAPVAVGEPSPQRSRHGRAEKRRTERDSRPLDHVGLRFDAELLHIERQERQQHAEAHQRRE